MRILVVEDEKHIAGFIKQGLQEAGYAVDVAYDGEEGYFLAGTEKYDLIVLDIMLPKMDGISVCKNLRKDKIMTPILMLTAKDFVEDKVEGLDAGAEDYLTKPFAFKEFLARIRALLRRKETLVSTKFQVADLILDLPGHKVTRAGKEIPLTAKEFQLLEYLMRYAGQVVTRTDISECVWDTHFSTTTNTIDVHIHELRRKIDEGHKTALIGTVRGRGYMIKG
ncbi:MAG: response regulator transcription factor [Candidatus Omnitrophica bacterium]|nr:response regulator transcription factor [Candidatus Omnitrophota bacterium]MDE2009240.1 response regulator transcription factor [Candidatus Omnitrophota bacterium]MDE2213760.1 response regulator transcription factor [Candidatus Omnitrophota bacterium]MDE2230664.1 response regulator transcription factor [Candidatus Omnitrophota bacterium]